MVVVLVVQRCDDSGDMSDRPDRVYHRQHEHFSFLHENLLASASPPTLAHLLSTR